MKLPKIRENLLVQDLTGEALIYDQTTNKSFCLNSTAKTVFNACDGKKFIADLTFPDEIIYLTLYELKKNDLIEENYDSPFTGMNRREVIKKVGLTNIIALPLISSLVAPSAALAASGVTCNPCTITFPGNVVQFPVPVDSNTGGFTTTGCVSGCTFCSCTIPGGQSSCSSVCAVS